MCPAGRNGSLDIDSAAVRSPQRCYSAQVRDSCEGYARAFSATIDLPAFLRLYGVRAQGERIKPPKGMDHAFCGAKAGIEEEIWSLVQEYRKREASRPEQELFK